MKTKEICSIIDQLVLWFESKKYKGYDIYDLFDVKLFHKCLTLRFTILRKIIRRIISYLIIFFPNQIIGTFGINHNINSKSLGLILKGYCNLYRFSKDNEYLVKALKIYDLLMQNKSKGYSGLCWGYPFDWSGSRFIPKNTPSSVVTAIIGDGIHALYSLTGQSQFLEDCKEICEFFVQDLNIDHIDSETICFSYTPIDNDHVHNANLFAAEFLIRIGAILRHDHYTLLGRMAVNYALREQNEDGSLFYWGNVNASRRRFTRSLMDHYHTGFELRKLFEIAQLTGEKTILMSFDRYYTFYRKRYITESGIYNTPKRRYPLDIHSCAEFIICNSKVNPKDYYNNRSFANSFNLIISEMLDTDGLFIYQIRSFLFIRYRIRFKFFRWAQAWMFLALTEHLSNSAYSHE